MKSIHGNHIVKRKESNKRGAFKVKIKVNRGKDTCVMENFLDIGGIKKLKAH